ncbi:RNA-binding protein 48 [Macrosteles quadrilineatus]|uniref:RNA-binding protein 48 n=1 Tax=Macrosteles quadrilineatus TaxID=74068 RepID=UPI0023E09D26|nr:RNA-binding protein 48 [Macrosteles quadrilineatus]XP_054271011.1 RNA-binding protein 48 [Macrosteles quadrilineatus]
MDINIPKLNHHEQQELCSTRPSYRQGRKLTAVKVYTVSDESTHLLVSRVPALQLHSELSALCSRFGTVTCCVLVPGYDGDEAFTETYHVQYARLQSARFAKRQLDTRSFFGGVLHVCYAPELETVLETRNKLVLRRKEVASRVRKKASTNGALNSKNGDSVAATQPQKTSTSNFPVVHPAQPTQEVAYDQGNSNPQGTSQSFYQPPALVEPHGNSSHQTWLNPAAQGLPTHLPPQVMFSYKQPFSQIPPFLSPQSLPIDSGPNIPNLLPTSALSVDLPSKTSNSLPIAKTLKFIPRQVSVKKQIIFHRKS